MGKAIQDSPNENPSIRETHFEMQIMPLGFCIDLFIFRPIMAISV